MNDLLLKIKSRNKWWETGAVTDREKKLKREGYLKLIRPAFDNRKVLGIIGLRRTGKTTLVFQAIDHLLTQGTAPEQILYVLMEDVADDVKKYLLECDEIWHAGDIGGIEPADDLSSIKPFRGVYGNIDDHIVRSTYPLNNRFKCEDVDVLMTHIGGYPGRYEPRIRAELQANPPKLFISGHSHILKVIFDNKFNVLHMNPGAAGSKGFHKIRTLLRFTIDGADIKDLSIVELPKRLVLNES